jgi:hypothetical protein
MAAKSSNAWIGESADRFLASFLINALNKNGDLECGAEEGACLLSGVSCYTWKKHNAYDIYVC